MVLLAMFPWTASSQETEEKGPLSAEELLENLERKTYSGEPLDLVLHDVSLQEVISAIEQAGGIRLDMDPAIDDKVTYQMRQIPWDEALATVLVENDLRMDIDPARTGFKIYRGKKSIVVFNDPAKLRFFLFLYAHLAKILTVVLILVAAGIGLRFHAKRKARLRSTKKKPLLPTDDVEAVKKELLSLLDVGKVYRQNDLSLQSLAEKLSVTPHQLSWIVNDVLGVSFSDLVNGYRIEEVKGRLSDPDFNRSSILQVAFEAGFNSKAAFNRAFKKQTGMTPSQFKRSNPR
jgi:AraC-like DNA-binding protein